MRQKIGKMGGDFPMRFDCDVLLAGIGGESGPGRARANASREPRHRRPVGGRRRKIKDRIAGRLSARNAEKSKALGVRGRPREASVDLAEDCAGESRRPAPEQEGAGRKPRVDEGDGNGAPFCFEDQIRPEFASGEECDVRPPVGEERDTGSPGASSGAN